jgi:hypothetical protein
MYLCTPTVYCFIIPEVLHVHMSMCYLKFLDVVSFCMRSRKGDIHVPFNLSNYLIRLNLVLFVSDLVISVIGIFIYFLINDFIAKQYRFQLLDHK